MTAAARLPARRRNGVELQRIARKAPGKPSDGGGQLEVSVHTLNAAIEAIGTDADKIKAHLLDMSAHAWER